MEAMLGPELYKVFKLSLLVIIIFIGFKDEKWAFSFSLPREGQPMYKLRKGLLIFGLMLLPIKLVQYYG
ncbi:hypothetical protein SG34_007455 [Thalassomonas viridans]|uniref:Uncharacterized protein n=1 Tax=Thalassomonas viridans TaxID=137584 RepID=A0AAE9Z4S3_9GAMM|nr:hypothetical protein [Thalassomonas viridans]WDE06731.1 hypothetical protein SG34_007455 [Thalassomonas viridans]